MIPRPGSFIAAEWTVFALSWLLAAGWSSVPEKRPGVKRELPYRLVLIVGGLILAIPSTRYEGPLRLWQTTRNEAWACVTLIALGFAFAWWARIHLGALWSGSVVSKTNHQVVESGPYGLVRHPIYTGILLSTYATAIAKGTVPGLAGALVITIGIWMKARLEEVWLEAQLEAGAYAGYRRRVSMLIPFGPKTR